MYKIVANWKMYLSIRQSRELAAQLAKWWQENPCRDVEIIVCPSALAIGDVRAQFGDAKIRLGVQDLSLSKTLGAFTGQIAPQQAIEAGASYAILGHSEMRRFYHVTDAMIQQQVQSAFAHKLYPIICVGESEQERAGGKTDAVIMRQLHAVFEDVPRIKQPFSVAYEPLWAIGSGKPVDPKEAQRVHQLISHILREFTDVEADVLYGGSVDPENAKAFLQQPSVKGLLIGSASIKSESLRALVSWLQTTC